MVLRDLFRLAPVLNRFCLPPLGPYMDGFCDWLHHQGYCRQGIQRRVRQVAHFNHYLRRRGVKDCQEALETSLHERFIREHLPRCRCVDPWASSRPGTPSAVRSLIACLSEAGHLRIPSPAPAGQQKLLQEYLDYLKYERQLAETTVKAHRYYLTPFVEELGPASANRLCHLQPEQVLAFFIRCNEERGPNLGRRLQGPLRSFLRFSLQNGYITRDLAEAIPPMRVYKLSAVPRGVSQQEVRKTLECIDRATPAGLRDFAILQLLDTYGVRGGQIRALQLQDIQWRENRIRFPPHKGGKELIAPLAVEAGESLLDYLRHGRPQASYPEVFLTAQPPFRPLRSPATVSEMVAKRLHRAGVSKPKACSHALRHGFATRMLQHGQSLKTIADLLGHRNINTTFIYTKVDLGTLRQLPLDWPGVGS